VTDWCAEPAPPLLRRGIEQFNRGEFFEQHETLEELWRAELRPVRDLYQGILQIGVAFHHLRRNNFHGTVYMLARGPMYLSRVPDTCQQIDVAALRAAAARALNAVQTLGPDRLHEFDWSLVPRVTLI
jgi:predicted metal-dependent hydrolase